MTEIIKINLVFGRKANLEDRFKEFPGIDTALIDSGIAIILAECLDKIFKLPDSVFSEYAKLYEIDWFQFTDETNLFIYPTVALRVGDKNIAPTDIKQIQDFRAIEGLFIPYVFAWHSGFIMGCDPRNH